jgi:transcriptional regulator with XRE-family HTH domain
MKQVSPIDKRVGARLRMRRIMLHMSQTELGNALGVTFQQVQKYEKGSNRVSASRLQYLCEVLNVPMAFFFDGARQVAGLPNSPEGETDGEAAAIDSFLATSDGVALVRAFPRVRDPKVRQAIVAVVEQIVGYSENTVH